MKIVINVRFLIKDQLEGIGVFTNETLSRLTKKHPEHQFYFVFDRKAHPDFSFSGNIIPVVALPPARHPLLWCIWFQISLKFVLRRIKPDIFVSMDGFLPLASKIKKLAVIHDIAFEHYPKDIPFSVRKYYLHYFPKFAKKADRIATVSEYSKNDIIFTYHIPEDKIDIVYNAADDSFRPLNEEAKINIKRYLTDGKEYFIYTGALHARKNIVNLLKAYEKFRLTSKCDHKLVLVGRKAWKTDDIELAYAENKFRDDIIFTGRVDAGSLKIYLAASYALTYLSYFEGFGLPLIEAFKCDVPVITSNCASLPEVAGNAALFADPFDIDDIALKMKLLAEDIKLRDNLVNNARIIRQKYSWDRTADLLWEAIIKTIATNK